jgi:hypothetical protein
LQIANIALPLYPGQPLGDAVLTVFATQNGKGVMKSRKLGSDDLSVVALIYPNANIEIRTGADALSLHRFGFATIAGIPHREYSCFIAK